MTMQRIAISLSILAVALGALFYVERGRNDQPPAPLQQIAQAPRETVPEQPTTPPETPEKAPHPVSLPALFVTEFNGSNFTRVRVLERTDAYTRHYITYTSGNLTISGIMNTPHGNGPFPVLILNHGHIDTSVYTNGRGLRREQDALARAGYAVVHPDYRNHAQSGKDARDELAVRLGYVEDVINAIVALQKADLTEIDAERVGMLGHSMGGGITLAALTARPDLIDAAVLYAPVSGDMRESYERWMSRRPESGERIATLYGSPEKNPDFWDNISSETFYDRITAPVAIFHGTADADVPLAWSEETQRLLKEAGKDASFTVYPNAPHEFVRDWPHFIQGAREFFDEHVK